MSFVKGKKQENKLFGQLFLFGSAFFKVSAISCGHESSNHDMEGLRFGLRHLESAAGINP
jgi:hypothetical protein